MLLYIYFVAVRFSYGDDSHLPIAQCYLSCLMVFPHAHILFLTVIVYDLSRAEQDQLHVLVSRTQLTASTSICLPVYVRYKNMKHANKKKCVAGRALLSERVSSPYISFTTTLCG